MGVCVPCVPLCVSPCAVLVHLPKIQEDELIVDVDDAMEVIIAAWDEQFNDDAVCARVYKCVCVCVQMCARLRLCVIVSTRTGVCVCV